MWLETDRGYSVNSRNQRMCAVKSFLRYAAEKDKILMSIDNVEKFVARYGKKAQETSTDVPEHLYPHMWRHSRAMHLYRNGMPLPLVAEWLGHAKMDTTMCFMQMLIQR